MNAFGGITTIPALWPKVPLKAHEGSLVTSQELKSQRNDVSTAWGPLWTPADPLWTLALLRRDRQVQDPMYQVCQGNSWTQTDVPSSCIWEVF